MFNIKKLLVGAIAACTALTAVGVEARAQVFVRGKIAVRQGNIASSFSFDFHSFSFGYKSRKLQVF